MPPDASPEISDETADVLDLRIDQSFDPGMSTDIHHFGAEYSSTTIEGGKGLVQLGHVAADAGIFFY